MNVRIMTLEERVEALKVENSVMREALQWAYEMLEARDHMNAKVHCSPVKLSPITERIAQALNFKPSRAD